jgi:hypothetical protein
LLLQITMWIMEDYHQLPTCHHPQHYQSCQISLHLKEICSWFINLWLNFSFIKTYINILMRLIKHQLYHSKFYHLPHSALIKYSTTKFSCSTSYVKDVYILPPFTVTTDMFCTSTTTFAFMPPFCAQSTSWGVSFNSFWLVSKISVEQNILENYWMQVMDYIIDTLRIVRLPF